MDTLIANLPPALQGWAVLGAVFAGALAYIFGSRRSKQIEPDDEELSRLRFEAADAELRRDLEKILAANRSSFFTALGEMDKRVRANEQDIAVLKARRTRRAT